MTIIKQDDLIQSVADALQYISYYHPPDFIRSMAKAYDKEQSPAAYAAFFHAMLDRGVYLPPSPYEAWFVSAAHDDAALARIADALPAAAEAAAAALNA